MGIAVYVLAVIGVFIWAVVVAWAIFDAFETTELGCLWLALLLLASPITLPLYVILKLLSGKANKRAYELSTPAQEEYSRFANDFEKLRFIRDAEKPGGTMYDPGPPEDPVAPYGFFTDDKAEELLREGRREEAWKYLIDLFSVALDSGNKQAMQTYSHYIHKLPDGKDNLVAWLNSNEGGSRPTDDEPRRSLPF